MFEVIMQSDDFGRESFQYGTIEEALAGIRRLYESATAQSDGVERIIGLRINGE
jgi:hypothetical protein